MSQRSGTTDLAIEASQLVKSFGSTRAVDGVDLAVPSGAVYGLLGPNGAGKTTTIRMLATLLRPDSGTAHVLGHDIVREAAAVRRRVSLTGQHASVDEELTGRENLVLLGRLLGYSWRQARARAAELLDGFGLVDAADRLVKTYSGGMRRRLDIAASIVATPDLMFLDEPTVGLDPHSRIQTWDVVRRLVDAGTTILLTTQYLEEADQLAQRIAVVDDGRVIAEGTPTDLKTRAGTNTLEVRLRRPEQRPQAERTLAAMLRAPLDLHAEPASLTARGVDPERAGRALAEMSRSGVEVARYSLGQPSLDEVFLALTGRSAQTSAQTDTSTDEEAAA